MRATRVSVTGVGVSAPIPLNINAQDFQVGIGCSVSGTVTYKVQHTYDDVFAAGFDASTATWFDHATITGKTAAFDGNYTTPVTAVRLNVTSGTGTANMIVIQGGSAC